MEDTSVVEASAQRADERNTPTTAGVRSEYSSIGQIEERNQEENNLRRELGSEDTGKMFVVLDGRGSL